MIAVHTPKGKGMAAFLLDYGLESDLYFIVFQESGEIWTFSVKEMKLCQNITAGRRYEQKKVSSDAQRG